jgi:PAS domain S-box-containing protein
MSAGNDKRRDSADPAAGSGMDLRRRAEEKAAAMQAQDLESLSPEEAAHLVHELRVHQIELEMQNEELRRTQQELEASRARYFDLYDLAPVGYVTLSQQGTILEANLTAATLLRVSRGALVNRQLTAFILPADQDIYYRHRKQLFEKGQPQVCELGMVRPDNTPFWVLLDATVAQDEATGAPLCRVTLSDITERKQAEEALRDSEERFRFLTEQSLMGIHIIQNGKVSYANKASSEMCGYSIDEITNWERNGFARVIHPDDLPVVMEQARRKQAGEKGTVIKYQWRMIAKSGEVKWIESWSKTIMIANAPADFATMIDITERKGTEEALRTSQERLFLATEGAGLGIWNWNIVTGELIWNDKCKAFSGIRLDETMSYQRFVDALHPDDREKTDRAVKDALGTHNDYDIEYRSLWSDGSIHWLAAKGRGYYDATGKAVRMEGVVLDITESKRAEKAMQESEGHYRLLAENLSDVIWTMGTDLKYTYVSPSVTRLRGYSVEEAMAQPLEENLSPGSVETAMRILAEEDAKERTGLCDPNRVVTMEVQLSCKDGSAMWAENKVSYVRDADGRITGYLGVTRDITERKKAEEALRGSEEKFRAVFMQSPIGIVLYDQTGAQVALNKACREIFGLPDAGGIKAPSLLDDPAVTEKARQRLNEGKTLTWEGPLDLDKAREAGVYDARRSGIVHVRGMMLALGRGDGQALTGYMALLEDVTERKKVEQALRESEEKFRAVFMQSPVGLQLFDAEGKDLIVNPACLEIFGAADPSEIKPLSLFDSPFIPKSAKEESRKGESVTFEVPYDFEAVKLMKRYGTPKSGVIHLNVGVTPVRLTKGSDRVIHYLVQVQDVTERKQAEEKIKQQLLELQRWHNVTLDREGRVRDLKQEVNELLKRLGEPGRYSGSGYGEAETPLTEWGGKESREQRQRP